MLAKLFQQHHLKIFFSNKFVHTSVLDKVKASAQISVSSNSKLFQDVLGEFAPKNDLKACLLAGSLLAKRCRQAKVGFLYWDGHISQKSFKKDHTEKAEAIWKTVAGDTSKLTRQEDGSGKVIAFEAQEVKFPAGDEGYETQEAVERLQEEIAQQLLPSARSKTLSRITRGKVADHLAPEFQQQPWKLMSKRQRARRLTRKLVGAPGTSR